jgi:hypothetical protein
MMAFCLLFSSILVINTTEDLILEGKAHLPLINELIDSLKQEGEFESEQGLTETLPCLVLVSREVEDDAEITSCENLESILKSYFEGITLKSLSYIKDKHFFKLPENSSLTPFCEGVQSLIHTLTSQAYPVKLGGY